VLGAGAMRTAGLRSISAKQLALSCQCVSMLAALHPLLRAGSLALVSQPRRALLIPEFDRLLTDLTLHTDEIHTKLVDIMRDRLAASVAALPAELQQVGGFWSGRGRE
jgi:vacuolar protein sorting-associated protein 54